MAGDEELTALVLAAGQGTRMKSHDPKVLHPVAGRPLVAWPVEAALAAGATRCIVVVGHDGERVGQTLRSRFESRIETADQPEQRGTGDAVRCGLREVPDKPHRVVILYGDCPLIRADHIQALTSEARRRNAGLAMITARLADPTGYGRILRDASGEVVGVREHRDCTAEELAIDEVNPGLYACDSDFLRRAIASLGSNNAQGELYLTDVVALAARESGVASIERDMDDLRGVNDRYELAMADKLMRARINERLARDGVTIRDPLGTWIDADVQIDGGAVIEPQVHLRGSCRIGRGAVIDVGCVLTDVEVAAGAHLRPYTVATESGVGEGAQVGPFTHLRPKTELGPDTRVGNFVETKKTRMGRGSKANHLAYLGDGEIGEDVNVGAGTIFCNYDGYRKHVTVLEDGAFIGSDSQLVAPVRVGKSAYVASGSTVVRDVPADALAIGRARQTNKEGYASRIRNKLSGSKE